MGVTKYEDKGRKNMSWVKSYKNCIKSKKQLILPCCYQQFLIEFTKRWMEVMMFDGIEKKRMWVMKYEGECSENM